MIDVFLNEKFIGTVENAQEYIAKLKEERRNRKITGTLNMHYDKQREEIILDCTSGRARRPLIIVENGASKLTQEHLKRLEKNETTWDNLIEEGIIEYVDAAEEEDTFIALYDEDITPEHTHLEIDPNIILGITTSLVPYSNYGQSSRLNRGSKGQKQALGLYVANFLTRMDTDVSILQNPHRPLVRTYMYDILGLEKHPSGQNLVIALMSYQGQNMQDGIILNKGSIDRGLARSTYYRPYSVGELRYSGGLTDEIGLPDKEVKGFRTEKEYKYLEDDGIAYPGASLKEDDVIIGKTSPPRFLGDLEEFSIAANVRRESSVTVRHGEEGIVDMVIVTENEEGNKLVKVRMRDQRIPEVGDKFASRHGQKGVVGAIVPQADMPFSVSGIVPDIIFSPHSIPSRMTISHLIEALAGKVGALRGKHVDSTAFDSEPEEGLRKQLLEMGFREDGKEKFYNGITGEEFEATIFVGNMYYQKLKHMVANKLHARASGRIQLLTRQPIEGRSKGGGLRLGEMEKDCFVAHGASLLLKERFDSDKTIVYICETCGMFAIYDSYKNRKFCPRCGANAEISPIEISYAFKLLLDEIRSLGVNPRLHLKNKY
ncbi:MAG: DNA-directed RNA polymerase subunit B [Nanoarchaeota archaeon]|nr:DNA-directed RNA polymerase subunit B [Nanoarchaeota archaeon]MCG2717865.1 DNA-directed RNA polymerase subunit B [Nanoarchaeota archaeon]